MSWISEALNWTDRHSGSVQAVGTLIIAGVGFFSIWWQRRREEIEALRSRRDQAETLAIRLFPHVIEYAERVRRVANYEESGSAIQPTAITSIDDQLHLFRDFAPHMIVLSAERYELVRRSKAVSDDPTMYGKDKESERARRIYGPLADAAEAARDELAALVQDAAWDRRRRSRRLPS